MDCASSSVVLLARLGHFGNARALDDNLEEAYNRFDIWCKTNRHTTSIDEFSKQAFGMEGQPLVLIVCAPVCAFIVAMCLHVY